MTKKPKKLIINLCTPIILLATINNAYCMYNSYKQDNYSKNSSLKKYNRKLLEAMKYNKHGKLAKMLKEYITIPSNRMTDPNIPIVSDSDKMEYPLEIALSCKNIKAVILLLQSGANPILVDIIEKAIETQNIGAIGILLAKAQKNNQKDNLFTCFNKKLEKYAVYAEEYSYKKHYCNIEMPKTKKANFIYALLWDILKGKKLVCPKFTVQVNPKNNKITKVNEKTKKKFSELINTIRFYKKGHYYYKDKYKYPKIKKNIEKIDTSLFTIHDNDQNYIMHYLATCLPSLIKFAVKRNINTNVLDAHNHTPAHIMVLNIIYLKNLLGEIKQKKTGKETKKTKELKKLIPRTYTLLVKILTLLLQHKTNPCIKSRFNLKDPNSGESLWTLSMFYPDIQKILLKHGDLNRSNPENGNTVLHQLISCQSSTLPDKSTKSIKKVLKKIIPKLSKKQVNKPNISGLTPLHLATIYKNTKIIDLLIKNKANPDKKSYLKMSPKEMLESLYRNNKILPSRYKEIKKLITKNLIKPEKTVN
ncbi:hypothetical protein ACFLYU_03460 [Candidatus Dependentiae bacterium]